MPIPILLTKLHPPPIRPDILPRARLTELLDAGRERPLTLISAPAGYGKSTLTSRWLASREEPHAWLSLDDADNDLRVFGRYFVASVRTAFPEACPQTLAMLTGAAQLPVAALAGCLVNELDAIETQFNLALDDYHRIVEPAVHQLLSFLLRHPPRPLHLVIATRRDPPLPLSHMLAQGHATEVRLKDLEFTAAETKALLEQVAGIPVSGQAVANLQAQLEGWIAGLHLVLLNLRYQEDPEAFLSKLHGGTSRVQAYLLGEVLARQSPAVHDWLTKTSILNRFCAPLCESVCMPDQESEVSDLDGPAFVSTLVDRNLFCIALDNHGEWYRYHHLFQQILREQLKLQRTTAEIATFHSRASAWHAENGLIDEAIQHSLSAGNVNDAAQLVEQNRQAMLNNDRWYVVEKWLSAFPDAVIQQRSELLMARGWVHYHHFSISCVPPIIDAVESLLCDTPTEDHLRAEIDFFRGYIYYFQNKGPDSLKHLANALKRVPPTYHELKGQIEILHGLASQMQGRQEEAVRTLRDVLHHHQPLHGVRETRLHATLVYIYVIAADLNESLRANQLLNAAATKGRYPYAEAWSVYLHGLICFYRNDLDEAIGYFRRAVEQRYILHTRAAIDSMVGLALAYQATRQQDQAGTTLQLLDAYVASLEDPAYALIARSCEARLLILQKKQQAALGRFVEHLSPVENMVWWLEIPAVTQCRALLAEGSRESLAKAAKKLEELLQLNEDNHNTLQMIDIMVLSAMVSRKQGRLAEALATVEHATELAAAGGVVRPFVDQGAEMADLLARLLKESVASDRVRQILAAFPDDERELALEVSQEQRVSPSSSPQVLIEPLTNREEEVLELLAQRLSDKEIAERLFVSPATVNTHLKHIYEKLRVSNRREAVSRAGDLGILPYR